jgi:hypothetical protein
MPTVLPNSRQDMIQWFSDRVADWATNAAAIGLSIDQITEIAGLVSTAESSSGSATAARIDSKDATLVFYTDSDALRSAGADLIKVIKAYAESNNDPGVYALASVPPPSPPTPAGPPDKPTELTTRLLQPFGIGIRWKGTVSQSAYFGIWRKLSGETSFSLLNTTKNKSFDDTTIPNTVSGVEYFIAAYRDEFQVNSNTLAIQIGADGTGETLTLAA